MCLCSVRTGIRGTTACALVDSEAVEIKLSNFLSYLHQNRAALEALMFTLCLRLTDAEHRIEVMAHRGAEQRLGRLLLRLGTSRGRQGGVGLRDTVTVSVSQNELAKLAGMSRPHVTVTMDGSVVAGSCSTSAKVWFGSTWRRSPTISVALFVANGCKRPSSDEETVA